METITTIAIYFIVYLILVNSKLKTSWIIWASFMAGYSICYYSKHIINFLNYF